MSTRFRREAHLLGLKTEPGAEVIVLVLQVFLSDESVYHKDGLIVEESTDYSQTAAGSGSALCPPAKPYLR
jgi:hypothetical protein